MSDQQTQLKAQHNLIHEMLSQAIQEIKYHRHSQPGLVVNNALDLDKAESLLAQLPRQNLADYESKVIEDACEAGRNWVCSSCDFVESTQEEIELMLTGIAQVGSVAYNKQVQK